MLEMVIDSIRVSLMNYQRVVILKVMDTDRYLPIWIGPNEADSIALKLQDVSVPRYRNVNNETFRFHLSNLPFHVSHARITRAGDHAVGIAR